MKKVLLFLMVIFFAVSCQKDIVPDYPPVVGTPKLPPTPVTGSVSGIVVDENNDPVASAQVNVGSSVYTTDANGFFRTPSITLDKYISTVKVTLAGYHTAYRSFSANPTKNYVTIKMIPKVLAGTFVSTASGSISLTNGSSISFQANGVKDKLTGASYSGTVNVYASYIDPTTSDFGAMVPGSLMAEDAVNFYVLRSTGMMAVELESAAGVPLQLESTKPATMKMAIPASLLTKAPGTIDTWSLDNRGIWIKEGSAVKSGNAYEFQVSHFSFWNCDVPTSSVHITINVKDQNGNNLINKWVSLTSSTTFGTTWGTTDSLGNVSGMIPKDEALELKVMYGMFSCNTAIHTQNIGPYGSNSSVNIVATVTPASTWTVTGIVNDCSGNPLDSGVVILYTGYYQTSGPVSNGTFNVTISNCIAPTSIDLIAVDYSGGQQSATVTVPVTSNTINAGTITACGTTLDEFITYIVDGTTFNITGNNPAASLNAILIPGSTTTYISAYDQALGGRIAFGVLGASVGSFAISNDSMQVNNYIGVMPLPTGSSSTTFTSYGPVGQFVEGTFIIPFTASGSTHTMTGSFRIRRD